MSLSMKLAVLALLCPFSLAAKCDGSSCMEDQTSLMQMKSAVQHGTERGNPVDWKAEVDSMPAGLDDGMVTSAYTSNFEKVKNPIPQAESEEIEFGDSVHEQRKQNRAHAEGELEEQDHRLHKVIARENGEVETTEDTHKAVEAQAQHEVDMAEENYEAHAIKREQAEEAAVVGRLAGQKAGYTKAAEIKEDHEEDQLNHAENEAIESERKDLAKHAEEQRAVIDQQTARKKEAYEAYVKKNGEVDKRAELKVEADAHVAKTVIAGAEAIDNKYITDLDDAEASADERAARKLQEQISDNSRGAYLKGQWPEEPNVGLSLLAQLTVKELVASAEADAFREAEAEYPYELVPAEEPGTYGELTDDRAVTDSVPGGIDQGQVTSAWASNLEKEKEKIEAAAESNLAFEKKVYNERWPLNDATEVQLAADREAVKASLAADDATVQKAFARRIAVQKAAVVKMERARQAWEAHLIKKNQAEAAAQEGKLQGQEEGEEHSIAKQAAWQHKVESDQLERRKAAEDSAAAKADAAARAAVDAETTRMENAEKTLVAEAAANARALEARSAVESAVQRDAINGDEDKKNTYTMHAAELYAEKKLGEAKSAQEATDEASIGHWPKARYQPE